MRAGPGTPDILPIPDVKHVGLTTYDAKDPDTTYPPITMLRPPPGAPECARSSCIDDDAALAHRRPSVVRAIPPWPSGWLLVG